MSAKRRPRSFWKALIAELDGGATLAGTARRHGVSPRTLSWWRWALRRGAPPAPTTRLLPVVFSSGTTAPVKLEERREPLAIVLRDDVAFRVPIGSDVGYVAALVAAVRKTC